MRQEDNRGLNKRFVVGGLLGVSPIPVVGEVYLSRVFMDLLEDAGFKYAGIPAALLTRYCMYGEFYIPLYENLRGMF